MIGCINKNGAPDIDPEILKNWNALVFGCYSDDDKFYFFESNKERMDFLAKIPPPDPIEKEIKINPFVETLKQSTPEEIEEIRNYLKINQ